MSLSFFCVRLFNQSYPNSATPVGNLIPDVLTKFEQTKRDYAQLLNTAASKRNNGTLASVLNVTHFQKLH